MTRSFRRIRISLATKPLLLSLLFALFWRHSETVCYYFSLCISLVPPPIFLIYIKVGDRKWNIEYNAASLVPELPFGPLMPATQGKARHLHLLYLCLQNFKVRLSVEKTSKLSFRSYLFWLIFNFYPQGHCIRLTRNWVTFFTVLSLFLCSAV